MNDETTRHLFALSFLMHLRTLNEVEEPVQISNFHNAASAISFIFYLILKQFPSLRGCESC